MNEYIYPKQLADGVADLPKIPLSTQVSARRKGKITYTKIGRHVVYTRDWVLEYLENNKREANYKAE